MLNDYTRSFRQGILNRLSAASASAAAVASLGVSMALSGDLAKTVALASSAVSAGLALGSHRQALYDSDITEDHETAAMLQRQRGLMNPQEAATTPIARSGVSTFDWLELARDRDKYPAVFVSGKPGSGKTTLAEYLSCLGVTGRRYVISPHLRPTDFKGFDGYFGAGANFLSQDDLSDTPKRLEELDRDASVYAAMRALTQVVYDRLGAYSKGVSDFESIDVFVDETVAINLYFRRRCPEKTLKTAWAIFLAMVLTEPRKVGIRVWLLTQAQTVTALGLEGFNDLKGEMVWIRLNHNAINHAKKLRRSRDLTEAEWSWLASQDRPVLVDDRLATVPSLLEQRAAIDASLTREQPASREDVLHGFEGSTAEPAEPAEPAEEPQNPLGISAAASAAYRRRAEAFMAAAAQPPSKAAVIAEAYSDLSRAKARQLFEHHYPGYTARPKSR
jgi:hypothetical protein